MSGQRYLDEDVKSYRQSIFSESTKATYKIHLRSFLRFCLYIGYEPLPCTVETTCRYIAFLARSLSYSSIPGYLNIIRLLHVESGLDNSLSSYRIKSFLKGVNRPIGRPPKQKLPITVEILKQMCNVLDLTICFNKVFWAVFLIAFFTVLRKGSLIPKDVKSFNPHTHLCHSSVIFVQEGFLLIVKHKKNDMSMS